MRAHSIAVLGANSWMARDFIARFPDPSALLPFARNSKGRPYAEFASGTYDAIVNFVGIGDPARLREMGAEILSVTRQYDEMALDYLSRHSQVRYIFLSSGAAYGGDFQSPARDGGEMSISADLPQSLYGLAKQEAEMRHRALPANAIFDLRVFSYVSRTMDLSAQFLLAEMVRSIRNHDVFRTANLPMMRDYLHPDDFEQLIGRCLTTDGNMALDCYSQLPISKRELLSVMASEFGLQYEFMPAPANVNITGEKPDYYTQSRRAATIGYIPKYSSESAIVAEVGAILSGS